MEIPTPTKVVSDEINRGVESSSSLITAQKLATAKAVASEVPPNPYAKEAKHFTEIRILNRDVRVVLENVVKFSNLIGSVHYPDGDIAKHLALELAKNGLATFVELRTKRHLKTAEQRNCLKVWNNYVPLPSNAKANCNDKFAGKLVEVVSGDCVVVPYRCPSIERRVNLSCIRAPKMDNPQRDKKTAPYAREAKEYLHKSLAKKVYETMEYARKISMTDGPAPPPSLGMADLIIMDFGSVFLQSPLKSKVEELIQKHLAAVTTLQISLETSSANSMAGFAVSVIKTLAEGQKRFLFSTLELCSSPG